MTKRILTPITQLFATHRLIVSLLLPLLPWNSALADALGTRVQLGHFGIEGANPIHDFSPPFQNGSNARSYPYGSTSATAGVGTLSLTGQYTSPDNNTFGNASLKLNSYFADTVTIDAPGRTGQAGAFTVTYTFDGSYDANLWFDTRISLNCSCGLDAGDGVIPDMSSANNNGIANGFSYRGDDTYGFGFGNTLFLGEEQTTTLAFTFGQPFDFWLRLGASMNIVESEPGDVRLAISLVKWSGIQNIMAGGVPVTNATTISLSGTNWTQAVTNSLPLTTNQITQIVLTPTSFILRGTNGAAHGPFHIFSSTDISLTPGAWPAIYTNRYGAGGEYDSTNAIMPTDARRFYRVQ